MEARKPATPTTTVNAPLMGALTHTPDLSTELAPPEPGRDFPQYITDQSTSAAIGADWAASEALCDCDLSVETYRNQATLMGTVSSARQRRLAATLAGQHETVEQLINQIDIQS